MQRIEKEPDHTDLVLLPGRPLMVIRMPNSE
jgi:hypothetical protein